MDSELHVSQLPARMYQQSSLLYLLNPPGIDLTLDTWRENSIRCSCYPPPPPNELGCEYEEKLLVKKKEM